MSDIAIRVNNLGKMYRIGVANKQSQNWWQRAPNLVLSPFDYLRRMTRPPTEEETLWAIRNVSFEVKRGEVLGIIGRNGAGKSTLLKVLSRITEPTEGRAMMNGRVASLLEVGTGFHPELTGRENIYLNGAILGMKRAEIDRRFDEIVDFSGVEKFIDTPVKRYSSGMYVRLAFAVAAHLEPEILLVDEVLAVGDAAFQKKCLAKIGGVAQQGRTILFVSHNMAAVKTLCSRAILLHKGYLKKAGDPVHVTNSYLGSGCISNAERIWSNVTTAPGNALFRLHSVRVLSENGDAAREIDSRCPFDIEIEYWNLRSGAKLGTTIVLYNQEGVCVLSSISNHEPKWHCRARPEGLFRSVCRIPGNFLNEGRYSVTVLIFGEGYSPIYKENEAVEFEVYDIGGVRGDYFGGWAGVVRPMLEWTTEYLDS
jgi:lipopolysaccharide transport system ATP-binding protein